MNTGKQRVQDPGRFLAGLAGLVRNAADEYLVLKRVSDSDFGQDVWECVTGRVNQGEGFEAALHREVMEESGLEVQIESIIGVSHFYRGERIPENELQGIVFVCTILGDETVTRSSEHSEHRWISGQEAQSFLRAEDPGTVWFRNTLERAEVLRQIQPEGWAEIHGQGVTLG